MGHKKKSKRSKKKRHSSTSSSSSASAEEWVEMPLKSSPSNSTSAPIGGPSKGEDPVKRDDWMSMPGFIPVVSKEKINQERNRERKLKEFEEKDKKTYKPGESDRELNPYWKNGGTGVPEENKKAAEPRLTNADVGDRGLEWLRKAFVRTQEQAEAEGRSLEDVAVERWGSLQKLYDLMEEAERLSKQKNQERSRISSREEARSSRRREESHSRSHRKRRSRSHNKRAQSSDSSDDKYQRREKSRSRRKRRSRSRDQSSDSSSDRSPRKQKSPHRSQEYSSDSSSDNRSSRKNRHRSKSLERRRRDSKYEDDKYSRSRMSESKSRDERRDYRSTKGSEGGRKSEGQSMKFQAPKEDDDFTFGSPGYERKFNDDRRGVRGEGKSRPSWRKRDDTKQSPTRSENREKSPEKKETSKSLSIASSRSPSRANEEQYPPQEGKVLTENELAAKMMKAEIMGNDALVAKLKKQLEEARARNKSGSAQRQRSQASEEVVVLTSTDKKGFTKPVSSTENCYGDSRGRKRREKVPTHQDGKRERYFADDDKYTLQNMFEREKLETVEDSNALFAKLAFKSKVGEDDGAFDLEDVFMEQASRKDSGQKLEEKQRSKAIAKHKQTQKVLESCHHCLESEQMLKHTIIDIGNSCYLCVPSYRSLSEGHCLIVPSHHVACATLLDEEVWEEMQNYRKKLTQLFLSQDEDVVFFETAMGFGRLPHMVLHCVPMPKEVGDMAPIYFKKAILESETEWAQNKKVVDLSQKNVRRAIPKGLPYFAVDFGLQGGFAHVIEDEKLWPRNFAQTIIGGMMDLDHTIWRKERPENFEDIRRKVVAFTKVWRDFSKKENS